MPSRPWIAAAVVQLCAIAAPHPEPPARFLPGGRVLLDAHNAYPYEGRWADRLDRALSTGVPLAIEQDLAWCPADDGRRQPVVTHDELCQGGEPTLREYFLERIRSWMERALAEGPSADWPLVTLNLDFKTNEAAHHAAVWRLLGDYEPWLTTAVRGANPQMATPLSPGPLLVLTGDSDAQQRVFADTVPVGGRLRLFGAVDFPADDAGTGGVASPPAATAYRRWWNHPWRVVEPEGQPDAGDWTAADAARLRALVDAAHGAGLWIRFYTLNGHTPAESDGWSAGYNFGSRQAVRTRWRAAIDAGADFIATDQYEAFARFASGPEAP
jgi:hypothetical protein